MMTNYQERQDYQEGQEKQEGGIYRLSTINDLPLETMIEVFRGLDFYSLIQMREVSRQMRRAVDYFIQTKKWYYDIPAVTTYSSIANTTRRSNGNNKAREEVFRGVLPQLLDVRRYLDKRSYTLSVIVTPARIGNQDILTIRGVLESKTTNNSDSNGNSRDITVTTRHNITIQRDIINALPSDIITASYKSVTTILPSSLSSSPLLSPSSLITDQKDRVDDGQLTKYIISVYPPPLSISREVIMSPLIDIVFGIRTIDLSYYSENGETRSKFYYYPTMNYPITSYPTMMDKMVDERVIVGIDNLEKLYPQLVYHPTLKEVDWFINDELPTLSVF